MRFLPLAALLLGLFVLPTAAQESSSAARGGRPHNVIIFVADGLRYGSIEPGNAPNLARLKREGVDFTNSHSLFPTITTVNASAITTGHYIGDTGDFGNTLYTAMPMDTMKGEPIAALENDAVLAEMNQKFGGNYLNEDTLFARARAQGFSTAIIGKLHSETIAALKTPEIRDFMTSEGAELVGNTPAELAAHLRREVERYGKVIKAANIRAE